jgi:hypothetical protein
MAPDTFFSTASWLSSQGRKAEEAENWFRRPPTREMQGQAMTPLVLPKRMPSGYVNVTEERGIRRRFHPFYLDGLDRSQRARVERDHSDFPHFALKGAARLSITARIEGAHSDRAASASKKDGLAVPLPLFQARSLSPRDGG